MSAEIICVGTELLLGEIVNTNSQFLGQELANLGIPHYYQSVVGDNPERLKKVLDIAVRRSSILIFTGGLGPTPDDLTTETIADFFQVPLREKPELVEDITAKFAQRGRVMSPSNRKQALIPEGANILPNPTGTAPGIIWQPRTNLAILTFPGVPSEMRRMWEETAIPWLKSQGWGQEIIYSRTLRFRGIGESALAEKVNQFFALTNPTVAPYAGKGEVRLRISAKAGSQAAAIELIAPVEAKLRQIAGQDCFGADDDTLASVVGNLLLEAGQTIGVAESCTGGGLGAMLTEVPGSSSYFWGGIIAYDNQVKIRLLGVNEADLVKEGAVSATVAEQMAFGVQKQLGVSWGIAITGVAGPGGGTESKPVGLVYVGLAAPDGTVESLELRLGKERDWAKPSALGGDRSLIRYFSASYALDHLRRKLLLSSQ
ncbi:MAG: competence/damage-inducible protein A [Oscillatoria sp. PMC 1068.18]|nr:competence/damage-inducible protein A [Oscillatoria sp. PMC 1076.18]MEC4991615.1 competence/damage-inducible protein A [Oscillatoria sp. PMC 1068.18]